MKTYRINLTIVEAWTDNAACIGEDQGMTVQAESLEAAKKEAVDTVGYQLQVNYGDNWEQKYSIAADHMAWCVCSEDEDGFKDSIADGFETQEDACEWLQNNFSNFDEKSFYVDFEDAQMPADVWAVVEHDGSLQFTDASGRAINV